MRYRCGASLGLLLLLVGSLSARAQAVCPCFSAAQIARWMQLAGQTQAHLCICNPLDTTAGGLAASIAFKTTADGCDSTDQQTTLTVMVETSPNLDGPVCQVGTNGAHGLEGVPVQQMGLTPIQAVACQAVIQTVCGATP